MDTISYEDNYKIEPYIPFYKQAPQEIVNLDELETLCFKRVACLKIVELESEAMDDFESVHKRVKAKLGKQDILLNLLVGRNNDLIMKDNISHFMLRLAYCRTDEYRRWLTVQETRLFKHVLYEQTEKDQNRLKNILNSKSIKYDHVPREEWERLRDKIAWRNKNVNYAAYYDCQERHHKCLDPSERDNLQETLKKYKREDEELRKSYFKFNWFDGKSLIGNMQCFMHKGSIYLHSSQLFTIIAEDFRKELDKVLMFSYRHLPDIVKDTRLAELLKYVSRKELLEFEYEENKNVSGKVNLRNIDFFAQSIHYPPCMKFLHMKLSDDAHLKHYGRLQYGLFIKGIGLGMDESLKFWRQKFSPKLDGDKFDKTYSYNIRHSYGKEGKRADYSAWACGKIIQQTPGAGEYHGCPFKYFKDETMRDFLVNKYNVKSDQLVTIMEKKREGNAQIACIKLWDATHDIDTKDNVGNHPNAYVSSSLEYQDLKDKKGPVKSKQ
jgi:DNA primase large subunit